MYWDTAAAGTSLLLFVCLGFWVAACLNRCFDPSHKNKMCGVPGAKIGHSQLCFVVIHNVIIIGANMYSAAPTRSLEGLSAGFLTP